MKDTRSHPAMIRCERKISGEIIHMDITALRCLAKPGHSVTGRHTGMAYARGAEWEYLHVAIDDSFRISFIGGCPTKPSARGRLSPGGPPATIRA